MSEATPHRVVGTGRFYKGVTRDLRSPHRRADALTYTPGTTVEASGLDEDPAHDCGAGINFARTITDAMRRGPVVVRVWVPPSELIVDAGDKLRARRVEVAEIVDLARANLARANLADANLADADLADANLARATGTPIGGLPPGWQMGHNGRWRPV